MEYSEIDLLTECCPTSTHGIRSSCSRSERRRYEKVFHEAVRRRSGSVR